MRRALPALAVFVVAATGCGSHPFAGVSRDRAQALAVADADAWNELPLDLVEFASERPRARVLGTFRSDNRHGEDAWLTIFRWEGGDESDQACVWVWRVHGLPWRYAYEETRSVASGRPWNPVHERCVIAVRRFGYLAPDQTVGSEVKEPPVHEPQPVGPFGPVPRRIHLTDVDYGELVETDTPLRFPSETAPGTVAYAGLVLGGSRWHERPIADARITLRPSIRSSGISGPTIEMRGATAVTGRDGAFAFVDLPAGRYGYDIVLTAPGFGPYIEVHSDLYPIDDPDPGQGVFVGSIYLTRAPQFIDGTPYPLAPPGSGP